MGSDLRPAMDGEQTLQEIRNQQARQTVVLEQISRDLSEVLVELRSLSQAVRRMTTRLGREED